MTKTPKLGNFVDLHSSDLAKQTCLDVVGKNFDDAIAIIGFNKFRWRVSKQDKQARILTRDFRLDRINLEVEDGFVVKAHVG